MKTLIRILFSLSTDLEILAHRLQRYYNRKQSLKARKMINAAYKR